MIKHTSYVNHESWFHSLTQNPKQLPPIHSLKWQRESQPWSTSPSIHTASCLEWGLRGDHWTTLNYKWTAPKLTQSPGSSKYTVPWGLCQEVASLTLTKHDEDLLWIHGTQACFRPQSECVMRHITTYVWSYCFFLRRLHAQHRLRHVTLDQELHSPSMIHLGISHSASKS